MLHFSDNPGTVNMVKMETKSNLVVNVMSLLTQLNLHCFPDSAKRGYSVPNTRQYTSVTRISWQDVFCIQKTDISYDVADLHGKWTPFHFIPAMLSMRCLLADQLYSLFNNTANYGISRLLFLNTNCMRSKIQYIRFSPLSEQQINLTCLTARVQSSSCSQSSSKL